MISNKKKAVIHVAKAQTGMSEVEYRDMLGSFGVASSTDLSPAKFELVMKHFEALGFKRKGKPRKPMTSKAGLTGKIKALIIVMDLTEAYADGIARRMFGVDKYIWCDADQLRKITAALMYRKKGMEGKKVRR